MKLILFLSLVLLSSSYCELISETKNNKAYEDCNGQANQNQIFNQEPKIVQQSPGGKLYQIQGKQTINVVVLSGSYNKMGNAYGLLVGQEIQQSINVFQENIQALVENLMIEVLKIESFAKTIAYYMVQLFDSLLELQWTIAQFYLSNDVKQELRGIANGSGIPLSDLQKFNMIQQVIQGAGASSFVNTQGSANSDPSYKYAFQTIDWPLQMGIQDFPLITIYNPEDSDISYTNVGFAGLIGSISLSNSKGVAIQEKVWSNSPVSYSFIGNPFNFVLKDIISSDSTLSQVQDSLDSAKRTSNLLLGLSATSPQSNSEVCEYTHKSVNFYDNSNFPYSQSQPKIDNVMFLNQYSQPSENACFYNVLSQNTGKIDQQLLGNQLPALAQTGLGLITVFELNTNQLYFSYGQDSVPAYNQPLYTLNLDNYYTN